MKIHPLTNNRTTRFVTEFFLLLIFCVPSITAATLNVPSVQFPTVQSAVNAALPGDTIVLQSGVTFVESVVLKYKT